MRDVATDLRITTYAPESEAEAPKCAACGDEGQVVTLTPVYEHVEGGGGHWVDHPAEAPCTQCDAGFRAIQAAEEAAERITARVQAELACPVIRLAVDSADFIPF